MDDLHQMKPYAVGGLVTPEHRVTLWMYIGDRPASDAGRLCEKAIKMQQPREKLSIMLVQGSITNPRFSWPIFAVVERNENDRTP